MLCLWIGCCIIRRNNKLFFFSTNNSCFGGRQLRSKYTILWKAFTHPSKIVEIRCSNHFCGHRCIKASTKACRLFLQTFMKERVALRSSVNSSDTVIGYHLCNKSSHEISSLLNIPQSTVSGILTKWKRLGMTATQPWSGMPHKMTEQGQRMLRHIVRRGRQLSAESIATDLQTSCGLQISSRTVCRELHGMGFHGRAAASKPNINKCNAKRQIQWCKAHRYWTLECSLEWQIVVFHLEIWWKSLGLVVARSAALVWLTLCQV